MFGHSSFLPSLVSSCTTDNPNYPVVNVAAYQFNNAMTSIPNNTYPGTAVGALSYTTGKFNNAVSFGGSSGISLPTGQFNYSDFTISSWVYPTTAPTVRGSIMSTYMYTSGPSKGYVFGINANQTVHFSSYYDDSGNRNNMDTTQTVPLNTWTYVAITYNSIGNIVIYINGTAVKTEATNSNPVRYETNNNTSIGMLNYSPSVANEQYFVGGIDQLRVFDSVLTSTNITSLYDEIGC